MLSSFQHLFSNRRVTLRQTWSFHLQLQSGTFILSLLSRSLITIHTHNSRWCQTFNFSTSTFRRNLTAFIGYKNFILNSACIRYNRPAQREIGKLLTCFLQSHVRLHPSDSQDPTVYFITNQFHRTSTGCVGYKCLSCFPCAYVLQTNPPRN